MLFTNVMKTLILIALFIAIPVLIFRLFEHSITQGLSSFRNRADHSTHKEKVR